MRDRGEHYLAVELWRVGAVREGRFRLSSGRESNIYVDLRRLPSYPRVFRLALSLLHSATASILDDADVIVGVATGGIQWAIGLAILAGVPAGYVRLEGKGHGLDRRVEADVKGRALVVDDVATTGGSLIRAIEALRREGYTVRYAAVLVDRGEGAYDALKGVGVELVSVLGLEDIMRARPSTSKPS
ncbi:MAG: orotate phosphoribosyltransferase [Desulfurococcales archaeon]|nr:orotate phosphoribosyltransferase [Desulfurococcales archaeon]